MESFVFPQNVAELADADGKRARQLLQSLAEKYKVNIIRGSVATKKSDQVFNTSYTYDRKESLVHNYNKVHLFSPLKEHEVFTAGDQLGLFEFRWSRGRRGDLDLRFVEWIHKMA